MQNLSHKPEQELVAARSRSLLPGIITLGLIAAVEMVVGWYRFFSFFLFPYLDDEGYMVITVREWMHHGALYDKVSTQYGPFFPVAIGAPLRLANRELTLSGARWISVAIIVATALALAAAVLVLTRSVVAAVLTQAGTFVLLGLVESAPLHPAVLIGLLLALLVFNASRRGPKNHRSSDVISGLLLAAIFLTKANIGIFALIALAYVLAATWPDLRQRRWLRLGPEAALVLVGPALLLQQLPRLGDVRVFGDSSQIWNWVAAYIAAAGLIVVMGRTIFGSTDATEEPFSVRLLAAGWIGGIAVISAIVLLSGTSPSGLINGVLVRPAGFAGAVTVIAPVPRASFAWLIAFPLVLLLVIRMVRWSPDAGHLLVSAIVRCATGAVLLVIVLGPELKTTPPSFHFGWFIVLIPLVAFVMVPRLGHPTPAALHARIFIVTLSITQSLHAFPVLGIQRSFAEILPLVCGVLLLDDGGRELNAAFTLRQWAPARWATVLPVAVALTVLAFPLVSQSRSWVTRYDKTFALGLQGASRVHTGLAAIANLREIVDRLSSCDQFVTYPGFNAMYLFTNTDPATGYNTTFPDSLLSNDEQQKVVDALEATHGSVCYFHTDGADPLVDGPFARYISEFTTPLAHGQSWSILVRDQA